MQMRSGSCGTGTTGYPQPRANAMLLGYEARMTILCGAGFGRLLTSPALTIPLPVRCWTAGRSRLLNLRTVVAGLLNAEPDWRYGELPLHLTRYRLRFPLVYRPTFLHTGLFSTPTITSTLAYAHPHTDLPSTQANAAMIRGAASGGAVPYQRAWFYNFYLQQHTFAVLLYPIIFLWYYFVIMIIPCPRCAS